MSEQAQPKFEIQRIYVKDLSLESPASPQVFREQLQPEGTNIDLNVTSTDLKDYHYEVVLRVTVNMKKKISLFYSLK